MVNITSERFIRLDYEVLAAKKLTMTMRVVLALIVSFERAGKLAYFSDSYLEWAGITANELASVKAKLIDIGLISENERGGLYIPNLVIFYKQLESLR